MYYRYTIDTIDTLCFVLVLDISEDDMVTMVLMMMTMVMEVVSTTVRKFHCFWALYIHHNIQYVYSDCIVYTLYTGCFFLRWYPPKKLKYGKPRLGESTAT